MRRSVTILAAAATCFALGCKEKTSEPTELVGYDADTDGPACVIQPARDKSILADQTQARDEPRARTGAPGFGPASTAPAAATPVAEMRIRLGAVLAAAKAGNEERLADLFPAPFDGYLRKMMALDKKKRILGEAARTRLGQDLTKDFMDSLATMSDASGKGPGPAAFAPGIPFRNVALDDVKFEAKGQTVVVTGPDGEPLTFAKTPQGWKAQLDVPPQMMGLLSVLGEMTGAQIQVVDGLIAGINDGSVTQANLKAKADALKAKHLKPAKEKLEKIFEGMMPTSGPASRPTTAPAAKPPPSGGF